MTDQMTIGDAAKHVGVSPDTLRRWEKKGRLTPRRSPSNRRYYTKDQLDELMKKPTVRTKPAKAPVSRKETGSLKLVSYYLLAVLVATLIGLLLIGFLG